METSKAHYLSRQHSHAWEHWLDDEGVEGCVGEDVLAGGAPLELGLLVAGLLWNKKTGEEEGRKKEKIRQKQKWKEREEIERGRGGGT